MKEADLNTKYSVTHRVPQFPHISLQGYTEDRSDVRVTDRVASKATERGDALGIALLIFSNCDYISGKTNTFILRGEKEKKNKSGFFHSSYDLILIKSHRYGNAVEANNAAPQPPLNQLLDDL